MTSIGLLQIALYFAALLALTKPLGAYMARVYQGERVLLSRVLAPVERLFYRAAGIPDADDAREMTWTRYAGAMLLFNAAGLVLTYAIIRLQGVLPLNPQGISAPAPDLAWNTATSFATNTNWQSYGGETTLSYFSQMAALAVQNFVSAASGMAVLVAVIRGLSRARSEGLGNFWVDLTRATLWVLLPMCVVAAIVFVSQGAIQNFHPSVQATTIEGKTQKIPQGPVASQEAIKQLGTNGGGFFNANSAFPYENPTPFTNLLQMLFIFCIGAGLCYTLGAMTGKLRHGWAVFAAMSILFLAGAVIVTWAEQNGNPMHQRLGIAAANGNMEGKEVRFGIGDSSLFATITTDASCGAVNSWHDSYTPIGGSVLLVNIILGEVIFGGVGAGMYGMILFIVLSVFIAGLMVGRTPEYIGKKIEAHDVKLAMLAVLILAFCILAGAALAAATAAGTSSINNNGPHGLSEMAYAFTSVTGNNGSAFAGLNANTKFYNIALGIAMFFGRFLMIIPMMGIAGSLAAKKKVTETAGTFPVDGPLFSFLLVAVVLIVGALTYFPVLSLGPYVEHFLMNAGKVF